MPGLRPGLTANVFVPLERKEDVLLIPVAAVFSEGDASFVWRVRNGRAERREVKLGADDDVQVEVLDGLKEGDVVRVPLFGPQGALKFGVEVGP
jgi:multidrug efflux pump subunit AcrA (membrane-fusion protein)